jgi:hypothetical protein
MIGEHRKTQFFQSIKQILHKAHEAHLILKHMDEPVLLHQISFMLLLTLLNCLLQTQLRYIMSA